MKCSYQVMKLVSKFAFKWVNLCRYAAAGVVMYYGLQATGVSAIWAGNIVQLTFVGGLSIAWIGSYIARVMNKDMTYVKQLKDYEDAVMAKRLEELPEAELAKMMEDISKLDPK